MGFAGKDGEERMEEVGDSVNWIEAITDQQLIMRVSAGGEEAVSSNNNNSVWTSAGEGWDGNGLMIFGFIAQYLRGVYVISEREMRGWRQFEKSTPCDFSLRGGRSNQ